MFTRFVIEKIEGFDASDANLAIDVIRLHAEEVNKNDNPNWPRASIEKLARSTIDKLEDLSKTYNGYSYELEFCLLRGNETIKERDEALAALKKCSTTQILTISREEISKEKISLVRPLNALRNW